MPGGPTTPVAVTRSAYGAPAATRRSHRPRAGQSAYLFGNGGRGRCPARHAAAARGLPPRGGHRAGPGRRHRLPAGHLRGPDAAQWSGDPCADGRARERARRAGHRGAERLPRHRAVWCGQRGRRGAQGAADPAGRRRWRGSDRVRRGLVLLRAGARHSGHPGESGESHAGWTSRPTTSSSYPTVPPAGCGGSSARPAPNGSSAGWRTEPPSSPWATRWGSLGRKELGLTTIAEVSGDSTAAKDTTVAGGQAVGPPLVSPSAPGGNKPEFIPGSIFRATSGPQPLADLRLRARTAAGLPRDRHAAQALAEGGQSRGLHRHATCCSPAGAGRRTPTNTSATASGRRWNPSGAGRWCCSPSNPVYRGFWRGPAKLLTNAVLMAPGR